MDKDIIKQKLRTGNCTVVFTKADGTERTMLCTLVESVIPEDQKPKGEPRKQNDDAIAVWDLDKKAWRSFRYDSIKQVV